MWSIVLVYDGYMWSWFWSMMIMFWDNQMWYVYSWSFNQTTSLTCCDGKWTKLQVHRVNKLPMRCDLNLQFILTLMGVMCLVQISMENVWFGVVEIRCKNYQQQRGQEHRYPYREQAHQGQRQGRVQLHHTRSQVQKRYDAPDANDRPGLAFGWCLAKWGPFACNLYPFLFLLGSGYSTIDRS